MNKILKLISTLSSGVPFASYELDTLIYRAESIKQRQQIVIPNLPQNSVKQVDLSDVLPYSLLVTDVYLDLTQDDSSPMSSNRSEYDSSSFTEIFVEVTNRKTLKPVRRINLQVYSTSNFLAEITLSPNYIYNLKSSLALNSLTFVGEPIHLRDDIVYTDEVFKP